MYVGDVRRRIHDSERLDRALRARNDLASKSAQLAGRVLHELMMLVLFQRRLKLIDPRLAAELKLRQSERQPFPRRVVIAMTPAAAREPYNEAAAAPLITSMLSMSSASMSCVVTDCP